jgi:hypothetical protein
VKIVALLSWFDEPPHLLEECVASLRGFADAILAIDGPYATYPFESVLSPPDNEAAIRKGAATAGIPAYIYDWFFCLDADERIMEYGLARETLEDTDLLAGYVLLLENGDLDGSLVIPQLFKAARGIKIGPAHYQYSLPDGRRLWCCHNDCVQTEDTHHDLIVEHRTTERSEYREARRWAYYLRRDSQQMEVPEFDSESLPALGAIGATDALAAGPPVAPVLTTAPH